MPVKTLNLPWFHQPIQNLPTKPSTTKDYADRKTDK